MTKRKRKSSIWKRMIVPVILVATFLLMTWLYTLPSDTKQLIKEAPRLETRVMETQITDAAKIVKVVEEVEEKTEFRFPFQVENLSVESLEDVDLGIVIDFNLYDSHLDYIQFYVAVDDIFTHILNLYRERPDLQAEFINIGRYLTVNNMTMAIAPAPGLREVSDFTTKSMQMADAFKVIYNGRVKWDGWIGPFRGCWNSPFYGKGVEYCEYLFRRGRAWENCLATLEAESTFGLGGTCYYGILYGSYSNTLQGYCDLLDDHGVSNDVWEQSYFWNSPGCPKYAEGMARIVNTIQSWYP
jgi:hypothetical protein